jgi:hypothetical protein
MGSVLDMNRRQTQLRLSDVDRGRWTWVERARKFIFELGFSVNSAAVERVLAPTSLVPTRVSPFKAPTS